MSQANIQLNWFFDIIMSGISIEDYEIRETTLFSNIPQQELDNRIKNYDHDVEMQKRQDKKQKKQKLIDRLKSRNDDIGKGILLALGEL